MENYHAIFQDLEGLERERLLKLAVEKFWIFVL